MTEPNIPQGAGSRLFPSETPRDAPDRFGARSNRFATVNIDLSNARDEKELEISGNFLWAIDASDLDAELTVKFNEQAGAGVVFQRGLKISGVAFGQLFISNSAQPGKSIKLAHAVEAERNITIENPLIAFQNVKLDPPNTYVGSGDQAIADLTTDTIAANSARREITIQMDNGNTGRLELRDENGNVFASLAADASMTLPGTGEIQVRNDSGAAQTYRYVEVED